MTGKDNMKWILVGAVLLILFSMRGTLPKEAVADINGLSCSSNSDCPCWGTYTDDSSGISETAYGLGVANCIDCSSAENQNKTGCKPDQVQYTSGLHCDTTWCYDVEPVAEWARDNPWQWMKNNPMMMVGIVILILTIVFWPKR